MHLTTLTTPQAIVLGAVLGATITVVLLYLVGRASGATGPNSRVRVREGVNAVLTKGS